MEWNGQLLANFVVALALEILLWKLPKMEHSSLDANVISGNTETIKICMNDGIMEENVSVQTKTRKNP